MGKTQQIALIPGLLTTKNSWFENYTTSCQIVVESSSPRTTIGFMLGLGDSVIMPVVVLGIIVLVVAVSLLGDISKKPKCVFYSTGYWISIGLGVFMSWVLFSGGLAEVLLFGIIPILVGTLGLLKTRN